MKKKDLPSGCRSSIVARFAQPARLAQLDECRFQTEIWGRWLVAISPYFSLDGALGFYTLAMEECQSNRFCRSFGIFRLFLPAGTGLAALAAGSGLSPRLTPPTSTDILIRFPFST